MLRWQRSISVQLLVHYAGGSDVTDTFFFWSDTSCAGQRLPLKESKFSFRHHLFVSINTTKQTLQDGHNVCFGSCRHDDYVVDDATTQLIMPTHVGGHHQTAVSTRWM